MAAVSVGDAMNLDFKDCRRCRRKGLRYEI